MGRVSDRIAELGKQLPAVPTPAGSYVPAVSTGPLIFTSGQVPLKDGKPILAGKVGAEVSLEQAQDLAAQCALNALAAIGNIVDLDSIVKVVKLVGFVASAPDFTAQPAVINGASDLLGQIFGDAGRHARSAVGVAVLPLDVPVEVELIVEVAVPDFA